MGPGFIRGVIVGAAASALGLSALSLSVPLPSSPSASTEAPDVATGEVAAPESAEVTDRGPDADLVEIPPTAPETAEAASGETVPVEPSITDSAALPEVGAPSDGLVTPSEPSGQSDIARDTADVAPVSAPPATAPSQAGEEVELSISTEPAQPLSPDVGEASAFDAPPEADAAPDVDAATDPAVAAGSADTMAEPSPTPSDPNAATDTAALPQVGAAAGALGTPATGDSAAGVAVDADAPVAPSVAGEAPRTDMGETAVRIAIDPERPQVGASGSDLDAPGAAADSAGVDVDADAPVAPSVAGAAPSSTGDETQVTVSTDTTRPQVGAQAGGLATPGAGAEGAGVAVDADQPVAPRVAGSAPSSTGDEDAVSVSTAPAQPSSPSTGSDAPSEPRQAALPQIGSEQPQPPADADLPETRTAALAPDPAPRLPGTGIKPVKPVLPLSPAEPPLDAYAEPFENPDDKPMMSIILIDEPGSVGAEALSDSPYPLTFALDPKAPGALEKMKAHRAVGFEVVALIDLPVAAQPKDAEVSLAVWLDTLDQVVGLLEGTGTGIQGNRPLSDHVTEIVSQTGHGLITQDNGLNTVQKLAVRQGVPSTVVFRDFDGAGQTPNVMRRFLDQAAFRAGQQGSVVMLGRMRPDTVAALLLWGLQDRADRVALAPISAILKQSAE